MTKQLRFRVVIDSETKTDYLSVEQLHKELFPGKNVPQLVKAIRKTPTFNQKASLVARVKGIPVGHVMFSSLQFQTLDGTIEKNAALIAPLAVSSAYQKQKIGTKLVQASLQKAKELGYDSLYVFGNLQWFEQFGFKVAETIVNPFANSQQLLVCHFNDQHQSGQITFAVDSSLITNIFEA
ncbi:MAG: GNAT family N-acetyltransferase, partial [Culicoidibacterales bacterium]